MLGQHGRACIQRLTCVQLACCVYAVAPVSSDQRSWRLCFEDTFQFAPEESPVESQHST